ncbi:MAG: ORF6N domain-containing protein [Bacteriovoracaceae bacterium]
MEFQIQKIEAMIYTIRGQKVMLDRDLAALYRVETKRLNEQVKRNIDRFPLDFMFRLTAEEFEVLKSQFATSKPGSGGKQKLPLVFTENGVAMLSGVLKSKEAIQVNISIMRTFTKLRSFLAMESTLENRMNKLEKGTNHLFKIVFERLDTLEDQVTPKLPGNRKKIGLKN